MFYSGTDGLLALWEPAEPHWGVGVVVGGAISSEPLTAHIYPATLSCEQRTPTVAWGSVPSGSGKKHGKGFSAHSVGFPKSQPQGGAQSAVHTHTENFVLSFTSSAPPSKAQNILTSSLYEGKTASYCLRHPPPPPPTLLWTEV